MWVNPEINASDAFVAAFLPGSEGGGVADVLIADKAGKVRNDFHGKLSFSWPKFANQQPLNVGTPGYDPLFAYGYGLTYADKGDMLPLPEESGLKGGGLVNVDNYFTAGRVRAPWKFYVADADGATEGDHGALKSPKGVVTQATVDAGAQENGRLLTFNGQGKGEAYFASDVIDLSRQSTGELAIGLTYKLDAAPTGPVLLALGRDRFVFQEMDIAGLLKADGQFHTLKVKLNCFAAIGQNMAQIGMPFALRSEKPLKLTYTAVKLASNEGDAVCPR